MPDQRRAWLLFTALCLSGGVGLPLGWLLPRWRLPWLWAAAGWGLLCTAASRGPGWLPAFYRALWLGRAEWLPLVEGWLFWGFLLAAALPTARRMLQPAGQEPLPPPGRAAALPDGTDLGRDAAGRRGVLTDAEANGHVLILGATGTGKTNALLLVLASALRRGLPLVALDAKGSAELRERLTSLAAAAGRDLDVWSFAGPCRYNPLRHGGPTQLRDKLMATETWTEPHYRRAAERYLNTVLDVLATLGRPPSLAAVAALCLPTALEALGKRLPPTRADALYAYLDGLDQSGRSAVAGLANRLGTLVESEAGPWLEAAGGGPQIDLLAAVRGGRPVLFSLDALRFPELAAQVGALVLQDLRAVAGEQLAERRPGLAYVAVDEFVALHGAQVLALVNRGREAGFCCLLATQDLADVVAAGGRELADQVLANTNVKLLLRQDVPASAERLAATVGTRAVWLASPRTRHGLPTGEASLHRAEAPLLDPNLLKRLPPHHAVLVKKAPRLVVQRLRLHRAAGGGHP